MARGRKICKKNVVEERKGGENVLKVNVKWDEFARRSLLVGHGG